MVKTKNNQLTFCIVGDQLACDCPFKNWARFGSSGVGVWDDELITYLEKSTQYQYPFWSPGYPLMGLKKFQEIKQLQNLPVERRWLEFTPYERGFRGAKSLWSKLPQKTYEGLLQMWLESIGYLLDRFPDISLLPITALYYSWDMPFKPSAYHRLKFLYGDRMVDISVLEEISPDNFEGLFGKFTVDGWHEIFPEQ